MVGKHFTDVELSRKDRALPLASMTCSDKIYDDIVVVDPFLIFQRIYISKQTYDDLKTYLQHELAPFPLALFDEAGMQKSKTSRKNVDLHNFDIVMDGGFLLHKVAWPGGSTCSTICQSYIDYILKYYSGYSSTAKSTKDVEKTRRYRLKKSVVIHFGKDTEITLKQDYYLCNGNNKSKLISMLSVRLCDSGIECRNTSDDADTLIVSNATDKSM
ncbi:hypothetical protein PR048_009909 [Dryococelus australis]|uniref:Uncharacterized protein n=1 Tax=Dryococelus australis TaxID=614101 RepID=A0ABQ9I181_9NEOP|nr:hypothetical protein PR048_009909 [Dryococelus australis]